MVRNVFLYPLLNSQGTAHSFVLALSGFPPVRLRLYQSRLPLVFPSRLPGFPFRRSVLTRKTLQETGPDCKSLSRVTCVTQLVNRRVTYAVPITPGACTLRVNSFPLVSCQGFSGIVTKILPDWPAAPGRQIFASLSRPFW